uniref:SURP motif domain-containing protein n=1 Tax=Graphocephala atropunctata TaxID=36148 RepID=A0A1B6KTR0_9HEMI
MSKDKRWVPNPNDPGILRKKNEEETEKISVFGYSCKIFRDDQRALEMDQGKHLIPWMGDETLKIDRYDARGHLSDLTPYDGPGAEHVPTTEEKRVESLCDEERYRAMSVNEEESLLYQEEEMKRLKELLNTGKTYGQVAYNYSDGAQGPSPDKEKDSTEDDDEVFIPSPLLDIPENMQLPKTLKENQIIEKTATHVASHGSQVEILIKTRQANNPKLHFLHVNSPLNPYYNLILANIKSGRYCSSDMGAQANSDSNQDHYLHPSLASTVESAPSIPSIPYKPSSDCAYNALVKSIRTVQEAAEQPREEPLRLSQVSTTSESQTPSEVFSAPLEFVFSTAEFAVSSSTGTETSQQKKKKRKTPYGHKKAQESQASQEYEPSGRAKKLISGMVKFAYSNNQDPATLLKELGDSNIDFTQPGHMFYEYYKTLVQETFKENHNSVEKPDVVENGSTSTSEGSSNPYDPENPTGYEEFVEVIKPSADSVERDDKVKTPPPIVTTNSKKRALSHPSPHSSTSNISEGGSRISKPAPVSFSIKKPKEERLEHASIFPLEESSSDEEGDEVKDSQPKSEPETPKPIVEKQPVPVKAEVRAKEEPKQTLRGTSAAAGKERDRSKRSGTQSSSQGIASESQHHSQASQKETKTEKYANGKHPTSHSVGSSSRDQCRKRKRDKREDRRDDRHTRKRSQKKKKHCEDKDKRGGGGADLNPLPESPISLSPHPSPETVPSKKVDDSKKKEERKKKVKEMLGKLKQNSTAETSGSIAIVPAQPLSVGTKTAQEEDSNGPIFVPSLTLTYGRSPQLPKQVADSQSNTSSPSSKEAGSKGATEETEETLRQRVKEALIRYNKVASEKYPLYADRPNSPLSILIRKAPLHLMSSTVQTFEEEKRQFENSKTKTKEKFSPKGIWDPDNPVASTSNSTCIRYLGEKDRRPIQRVSACSCNPDELCFHPRSQSSSPPKERNKESESDLSSDSSEDMDPASLKLKKLMSYRYLHGMKKYYKAKYKFSTNQKDHLKEEGRVVKDLKNNNDQGKKSINMPQVRKRISIPIPQEKIVNMPQDKKTVNVSLEKKMINLPQDKGNKHLLSTLCAQLALDVPVELLRALEEASDLDEDSDDEDKGLDQEPAKTKREIESHKVKKVHKKHHHKHGNHKSKRSRKSSKKQKHSKHSKHSRRDDSPSTSD